MTDADRYCVLVPAYCEARHIADVVTSIKRVARHVIVIDDGSDDATADLAQGVGATVLRHETNKGKGAALNTGFCYAREQGFELALIMDGDGQHAPEDIAGFLDVYDRTGAPVVIGNRMADPQGMPFVRKITNRFMSWLLSRQMGQRVPDTQCGFRLFRCDSAPEVGDGAQRFAGESEVLLDVAAAGLKIESVPIRVIYGDEKSKINPVADTIRFFKMLRRHGNRRKDALHD